MQESAEVQSLLLQFMVLLSLRHYSKLGPVNSIFISSSANFMDYLRVVLDKTWALVRTNIDTQ